MLMLFPYFVTNAMGRYISGSIQLTYQNGERESNSQISSQSSLQQTYRLNYSRYLLHRNLLSYSLTGVYAQEDREFDGSSFESESFDYNILLDFIRASAMPFSISAYRNTQNGFSTLNTGTPMLEQTTTGFALRGSVKLRKYPTLKYWVTQDDRERTGRSKLDDRRRALHMDLSKKWKNADASLSYDYRNTLDRLTDSETGSHTLNLRAHSNHRLSRVTSLELSANAGYDTESENANMGASSVLHYQPSSKFYGKSGTTFNYANDTAGSNITVNNNTSAEYRISRNLLSNGGIFLSSRRGSHGESTSESARGSLSYSATLPAKIKFTARTGAGYGASQGETNSSHYNADVLSSLGKSFRRIKTSLNTGAGASYTSSSDSDSTYAYNVNINGSNNYIKRLQAEASGNYSVMNRASLADERHITGKGSLRYEVPLGWRAKMGLSARASIERGDTSWEVYSAGQDLHFVLYRNLSLTQAASYRISPTSDSTAISANVDINYRIRRIFLTVRYNWSMEDNRDISTTLNRLKVQATRKF